MTSTSQANTKANQPTSSPAPVLPRAELEEQQRDAQLSARAWRKKHPNTSLPELDTYLRDVEQFDDAVARDVAAAVFKEDRSAVPADVAPSAAQPASGQASSMQNGTKKSSAQDESSQTAATGQPGAQGSSFSIEQAAEWIVSEWKKNPKLRLTWIRESLAKHGLMPEQADQAIAIAGGKAEKQSAKPTSSADQRSRGQTLEEETRQIAQQFVADLQKEGAKFLRDESGDVSVSLGGKLISLQETREVPNRDLDKLMSRIDCPGTATPKCRTIHKWLAMLVWDKTEGTATTSHKFSAQSEDGERIYVPVANDGGKLLLISKDGVQLVENINNQDGRIVNPAKGQEPFTFIDEPPEEGLRLYEEFVVNMQTVAVPEMAWFALNQEMLFAFVRNEYLRERAIVLPFGPSNSGKTGSIQQPLALHGFKEPTTKITPAALQQIRNESGILFLDNQEQHNLTDGMQDALIAMATGGEKTTAVSHFGGDRPIIVITSIESGFKTELKNRSIAIKHALAKDAATKFSARDHEKKLRAARNRIMSALMHVLVESKRQTAQVEEVPDGAGKFADNYRALCGFQRAYETVARKPMGWADGVISVWREQFGENADGPANEDMSFVVRRYMDSVTDGQMMGDGTKKAVEITDGKLKNGMPVSGMLYRVETVELHSWARRNHPEKTPENSGKFGARLSEAETVEVRVLRDDDVPRDSSLYPYLKRLHGGPRVVGFLKVRGS